MRNRKVIDNGRHEWEKQNAKLISMHNKHIDRIFKDTFGTPKMKKRMKKS